MALTAFASRAQHIRPYDNSIPFGTLGPSKQKAAKPKFPLSASYITVISPLSPSTLLQILCLGSAERQIFTPQLIRQVT